MLHSSTKTAAFLAPFFFVTLAAQQKSAPAPLEIPDPVNLKVLKAATAAEVTQVMRTFTVGLGVECKYCHVEGDFASDANPHKETARRMLLLLKKINADFPDGQMRVSCYTCHHGDIQPKTAPAPK